MIASKKKRIALFLVNSIIRILSLPGKLFPGKSSVSSIEPNKILLVRLDHIGDVIMTSPAFSILRDRFPDSKIILLTTSIAKSLFNSDPRIDEILTFNWPWSFQKSNNSFSASKVRELTSLIMHLRKENIDVMVDFRGDLRFILLFGLLSGIKIRVGNSRIGNNSLTSSFSHYNVDKHEVERSVEVIQCFRGSDLEIRPRVFLIEKDLIDIKDLVYSEAGIDSIDKLAIIAPFSSKDIKSWPMEYFKEVVKHLVSKHFKVLIAGAEEDKESSLSLVEYFPKKVFSLAGKTSIRQLAALTAISTIIIGVDTGVLHIASCFDNPIVAIFGPTRAIEFRPYSPYTTVLDLNSCLCNQFLHEKCDYPIDGCARCLHDLRPEYVIKAVDKILEEALNKLC